MPDSDPASPVFINGWRFHSAIASCSKNERIWVRDDALFEFQHLYITKFTRLI